MAPWKRLTAATAPLLLGFSLALGSGPIELSYLYNLADFTGTVRYSDARVVTDPPRSEVYTLFGNEVRVFNNAGMEAYRFEVDVAAGRLVDLAVQADGDMLMLLYSTAVGEAANHWLLIRADFRGRLAQELILEASADTAGLLPNRLLVRAERIWLASTWQMKAACYLPDGKLERALDLAQLAGLTEEERGNAEVSGLDVSSNGTVVFAVPVQFRVHVIGPGGEAHSFGKTGSGAGGFGVLGDVALDGQGNIFISDRQRSVVMAFSDEYRFLRESGRISNRDWLVRPGALAIDPAGRLYVSQVRDRGVAVFSTVAPR